MSKHEMSQASINEYKKIAQDFYRCTVHILFTHQQMNFLLNLEKLKFILKYT